MVAPHATDTLAHGPTTADAPRRDGAAVAQAIAIVLLIAIAGIAGYLRLQDPMSTPVIGAEDPFSHIVWSKEGLERGYFDDSDWLANGLYPPGIHALGGAVHGSTGLSLITFALYFPVVLGILSVIGVFLLVTRYAGIAGGFAGGLVLAVTPEHIFRTNLFFPTALDLAIAPFFLLGVLLVINDGRLAGGIALLATTGFALAYAHPWMIFILGGVTGVTVLVHWITRIPKHRAGTVDPKRDLRNHGAVLGVLSVLGYFTSKYNVRFEGDKGFMDKIFTLGWDALAGLTGSGVIAFLVLVVALAAIGHLVYWGSFRPQPADAPARKPSLALAYWTVPGLLLGIYVAWSLHAYVVAHETEMPLFVNYRVMLGTPLIVLGLIGIALAFASLNPAAIIGASMVLLLFPVTVKDLFDSWYLPHRTMVYVILGAAIAAGAGVGVLADRLPAFVARFTKRRATGNAFRAVMTGAAILAVAGYVTATPTSTYEWYRLYSPEEYAALEDVVRLLEANPKAVVVVATWQSNLVLKALADDNEIRVEYGLKLYTDPEWRTRYFDKSQEWGKEVYVLVDHNLMKALREKPEYDGSFLQSSQFKPVSRCCENEYVLYQYVSGSQGGS